MCPTQASHTKSQPSVGVCAPTPERRVGWSCHAGVVGGEAPIHGAGCGIAALLPAVDFSLERLDVRHVPVETRAAERAQLDFGDCEPTPVLRGMMDRHLVGQAPGFRRSEAALVRGGRVAVQVVQHERCALGLGIALVDQLLDLLRPGMLRPPQDDLDPASALGGLGEEEAIAPRCVLVVHTRRLATSSIHTTARWGS
jgi:hypothetical protein